MRKRKKWAVSSLVGSPVELLNVNITFASCPRHVMRIYYSTWRGTGLETTGISTQIEPACRAMVHGVSEPRTCSHGDSSQGFSSRLESKIAMPDSRSITAPLVPVSRSPTGRRHSVASQQRTSLISGSSPQSRAKTLRAPSGLNPDFR
jgi:hypothetical protein